MERASPAWQADSLPLSLLGRPKEQLSYSYFNNNPYFKLDACCCGPSCCSVTQLCLTLYEPMNCSSAGFPVLHPLLEFAQTLSIDSISLHWVSDAIQPTHPLSSPSPAFSLSQHQGLFQWVGSSHQVARVLEFQLQHQSFQWKPRTDRISLQSKGLSRVFSNTTAQNHQSFSIQLSLESYPHIHTWLLEKP